MGKTNSSFEKIVLEIVQRQFPEFKHSNYTQRLSRDGNYLALSLTVFVMDKSELDELYQALTKEKDILFVL